MARLADEQAETRRTALENQIFSGALPNRRTTLVDFASEGFIESLSSDLESRMARSADEHRTALAAHVEVRAASCDA